MLPYVRLKKRFLESITLHDRNILDKYLSVPRDDDDSGSGGGSRSEIYIVYMYMHMYMYMYIYIIFDQRMLTYLYLQLSF